MLTDHANTSTLINLLREYKVDNQQEIVYGNINFLVFLADSLRDITPDDCIGYTTLASHEIRVGQKFKNPFGSGVITITNFDLDTETIIVDLQYV